MIVNVTEEGLEVHGEVDHSEFYESEDNRWWNSYNIRRSIFMGDYIYAISHGGITVTHLDSLDQKRLSPVRICSSLWRRDRI